MGLETELQCPLTCSREENKILPVCGFCTGNCKIILDSKEPMGVKMVAKLR